MNSGFLGSVFTGSTIGNTLGVLTVVGILLTLFVDPTADHAWKVAICAIIFLAFTSVLFAVRAAQFYRTYNRRIPIKRQIDAQGLTSTPTIVVIENPGYLRDNVLLTLFSPSSGTEQPMAVLQITKAVAGEDIHATAFPIGVQMKDLSEFFDAENKTQLYVTPLIHINDLQRVTAEISIAQQRAEAIGSESSQSLFALAEGKL